MATPPPRRPSARSRRPAAASSTICWCRRIPATSRRILLKVQQLKPDVVATAMGGDDNKALREQMLELKLDEAASRPGSTTSRTGRMSGVRRRRLFGVFGTTWYHKLDLPGIAEFVKKWEAANKGGPIPVPGNVSYNGYMATQRALPCDRAGRLDQQHRDHQGSSKGTRCRPRPHAASRRLHRSRHTSGAADRLSCPQEPQAERQHRPLRSPQLGRAAGGGADDVAPTKCKLVPYEQVPTVDA